MGPYHAWNYNPHMKPAHKTTCTTTARQKEKLFSKKTTSKAEYCYADFLGRPSLSLWPSKHQTDTSGSEAKGVSSRDDQQVELERVEMSEKADDPPSYSPPGEWYINHDSYDAGSTAHGGAREQRPSSSLLTTTFSTTSPEDDNMCGGDRELPPQGESTGGQEQLQERQVEEESPVSNKDNKIDQDQHGSVEEVQQQQVHDVIFDSSPETENEGSTSTSSSSSSSPRSSSAEDTPGGQEDGFISTAGTSATTPPSTSSPNTVFLNRMNMKKLVPELEVEESTGGGAPRPGRFMLKNAPLIMQRRSV
ncbi:unnamed protein product [Amoebophrya sp. A25]|nr:unnamed protein product [Amoebophrya sp. A25]|eukprot:GSA25T00004049001.1